MRSPPTMTSTGGGGDSLHCDWDKQLARLLTPGEQGGGGFTADQMAESVLEMAVDDTILGVCFSVHRDARTGALTAEGLDDTVPAQFAIVDRPGLDVLGLPLVMKRPPDAQCPVCSRSIACPRFAPHLEKCVGLGRNSSRLASRRILAVTNQQLLAAAADGGVSDDDSNDIDWAMTSSGSGGGGGSSLGLGCGAAGGDGASGGGGCFGSGSGGGGGGGSERKRRRRDKLSPRRSRASRRRGDKDSDTKSNPSNASSSTPSTPEHALQYEQLSDHERRSLFNQVCGVITESTRHVCTRSVRCQQHTDTQRRSVRVALFGSSGAQLSGSTDCSSASSAPSASSSSAAGGPLLDTNQLKSSLSRLWDRASNVSTPVTSTSSATVVSAAAGPDGVSSAGQTQVALSAAASSLGSAECAGGAAGRLATAQQQQQQHSTAGTKSRSGVRAPRVKKSRVKAARSGGVGDVTGSLPPDDG